MNDAWVLGDLLSELQEIGKVILPLTVAIILGGLLGLERELHGRWAGLRTLMTVAMGSALFTMIGLEVASDQMRDPTRVVQGIAAGIGFLGAGTILKLGDQLEVKGLTTASAIWLSAALGTASGLGLYRLAITATVLSLLVLAVFRPFEKKILDPKRSP